MKIIFKSYALEEKIPVENYVRNRKLIKYFNRETSTAIVSASELIREHPIPHDIPFYYETGVLEYEDFGMEMLAKASVDEKGVYDQKLFVNKGVAAVHPLTQFKALYNMPLSFVSIELGLKGDNAVIYSSARGLLTQSLNAPTDGEIFLGCGKVRRNGRVDSAFAIVKKDDLDLFTLDHEGEAIDMFREYLEGSVPQ
jgi:hypothetical protein